MPGKYIKHPSEIRAIMVRKANLLYSYKLIPQIKVGYRFIFFMNFKVDHKIKHIYVLFKISNLRGTATEEFFCIKLICFMLF